MMLLNPSPTRFATHFLQIMRTLYLKYEIRGTVQLQEFIALKLRKEEGTFEIIKDNQSVNKRHILIKMIKPLLILLSISDSNHPYMDKIQLMVLMVDDHIRMSMPDLNDKYYPPPVT